jgi:hypothetical protein
MKHHNFCGSLWQSLKRIEKSALAYWAMELRMVFDLIVPTMI